MRQLLEALQFIHTSGYLHLDITVRTSLRRISETNLPKFADIYWIAAR